MALILGRMHGLMKKDEDEIKWVTSSPCDDQQVVLKESTFNDHVIGDHQSADRTFRLTLEKQVKRVVEKPSIVLEDKTNPQRYDHIRMISVHDPQSEERTAIHLQVIVDMSRTPHEVITWIPCDKLDIGKRRVIYDENDNDL